MKKSEIKTGSDRKMDAELSRLRMLDNLGLAAVVVVGLLVIVLQFRSIL